MTSTRTYTTLEISADAFKEILTRLSNATDPYTYYNEKTGRLCLDGIALVQEESKEAVVNEQAK